MREGVSIMVNPDDRAPLDAIAEARLTGQHVLLTANGKGIMPPPAPLAKKGEKQ
jgi:hypothetical protein